MGKISFSTRPNDVYYTYASDGHIYCISNSKLSEVAESDKSWNCYFECDAYHKVEDKYYRLYIDLGNNKHESLSATTYYKTGMAFSYYDGKDYKTVTLSKYYNSVGDEFLMPNDALELPHAEETDKDGNTTYYFFDTLITCGDTYASKKFSRKEVKKEGKTLTYSDKLLELVKDAVSTSSWKNSVDSNVPSYLQKEIKTGGLTYTAPDFKLFGNLFIEKLLDEMSLYGNTIVKSNSVSSDDEFKGVKIAVDTTKKTITCSSDTGVKAQSPSPTE